MHASPTHGASIEWHRVLVCQAANLMLKHKLPRAVNPDAPRRLKKQFVPPQTVELLVEILEVASRRLFVAFQPKETRDFVVAEQVHLSANYRLLTKFVTTLLNLFYKLCFRRGNKHRGRKRQWKVIGRPVKHVRSRLGHFRARAFAIDQTANRNARPS
jgi:hypothetical protein